MAIEVIMPALGMAQDTGIILSWLKSEGDTVAQGEPLMEIETDKATVEIEAPASGVLARIFAAEGEEVPVGQVVALIAEPGEKLEELPEEPGKGASVGAGVAMEVKTPGGESVKASPVAKRLAETYGIDLSEVPTSGRRVTKEDVMAFIEARHEQKKERPARRRPVSPKARRLMEELGVSPDEVTGTGPGSVIIARDVLAVSEARKATEAPKKPATPVAEESLAVGKMWKIMAERTTGSWTSVPHFYLTRELDVSQFVEWRKSIVASSDVKVTFTDLLVKAVADALRRFPRMNVIWDDGKLVKRDSIDVGLAVATEVGLVVPVLRHADEMGVADIARVRSELVDRARERRLRPDEIGGGSLTISNLGMYGIDMFSAIINPPEPAILAVGRIKDRAVVVNGQVVIRPVMVATLSCDHRAVDGAIGALFMKTVADMVEKPLSMLN